jgi:hypothetical protein
VLGLLYALLFGASRLKTKGIAQVVLLDKSEATSVAVTTNQQKPGQRINPVIKEVNIEVNRRLRIIEQTVSSKYIKDFTIGTNMMDEE